MNGIDDDRSKGSSNIKKIAALLLLIIAGFAILQMHQNSGDQKTGVSIGGTSSVDIPSPYYITLTKADVNSVVEIIRFADSIRTYGTDMDVWQRAAFYEWWFKNHGFNVSFAYAQKFGDSGQPHIWVVVSTKKEVIELEPSYRYMGASCMEPLEERYTQYEHAQ